MRHFVDLHTHTNRSDGDLTPSELVVLAERKRLYAFALTDHDTASGLAEAAAAAAGAEVRFIPGIEISAAYPQGTFHLIGLGINPAEESLRRTLESLRLSRSDRNQRMLARLEQLGIPVGREELDAFATRGKGGGAALITRMHVARLLAARGVVKTAQEAFERFIGPGRPAYVEKDRLSPAQAIAAVHAGGGLAILAHPALLRLSSAAEYRTSVGHWRDQGLDGIEVYHPEHTIIQTRMFLDLARSLGLLLSGGSDFHGHAKPDVRLGLPRVPVAAVEQLLEKLAR